MMAELPTENVTPARPFSQTDLDFAGPFTIKKGGDNQNVYTAVFVSLSTKAVHLELVGGLTKDVHVDLKTLYCKSWFASENSK